MLYLKEWQYLKDSEGIRRRNNCFLCHVTNFGIHKIRKIPYSKMLERTSSTFAAEDAHHRKGDQGENGQQRLPWGQIQRWIGDVGQEVCGRWRRVEVNLHIAHLKMWMAKNYQKRSGSLRSQGSQAIRDPVLGKKSEFFIIKKRKTGKRQGWLQGLNGTRKILYLSGIVAEKWRRHCWEQFVENVVRWSCFNGAIGELVLSEWDCFFFCFVVMDTPNQN